MSDTPILQGQPRRKLLVYTHAMTGGGAERVTALLASGFARAGWDVILAVDFQSGDNLAYLDPAVRIVLLGDGHRDQTLALARLLRTEAPDISLSALCISNLKHVAAALMAGRLSRAVLSYHGFFSSEPQPLSRMSYLLTPVLTRMAAATVCVSDSLRDYLAGWWRASAARTRRIYNPVVVREPEAARARNEPVVLAIGRLVAQKNYTGLVRAFALLERRDALLVIAGVGPERPAIEAEAARLGLAERVSLPGYLPEPWRLYGEASCFAVPSVLESFSLVVVEAMANGLPVVSTRCGGPVEILDGGRLGHLVPYDDARAMAQAIDAALRIPGDPGPRIARAAEFGLDAALAAYSDLFEEVLARGARPRRRALRPAPSRAATVQDARQGR